MHVMGGILTSFGNPHRGVHEATLVEVMRRPMKPSGLVILIWLCATAVASRAFATDVFFPDSSGISDNGRYRIDAKSPHNESPRTRRAFGADFTYTLTDLQSGKVLWTRSQPMARSKGNARGWPAEGSPIAVFASDTGEAAAYVSGEELVFMDARGNRIRGVDILGGFSAEHMKFVGSTTAGLYWTQYSWFGFVHAPATSDTAARLLFAIRPFWMHLMVFDATTRRRLDLGAFATTTRDEQLVNAPADLRSILTATLEAERAWVRREVTKSAAQHGDLSRQGRHAIVLAGRLELKELEPQLRTIETRAYSVTDSSMLASVRPHIRTALRRMGATPASGFGVIVGDRSDPLTRTPVRVSAEHRLQAWPMVKAGMLVSELVALIGHPDASAEYNSYDYDIDSGAPFTLRVTIHVDKVVRVETVPPAYLGCCDRER